MKKAIVVLLAGLSLPLSAQCWQKASAGNSHVVATTTDGKLWAWGSNGSGELGNDTTSHQNLPVHIGNAVDWQSVMATDRMTVAVKNDGTLWAWGMNNIGQLGDGTTTDLHIPMQIGTDSDWQSINGGYWQTLGIKTDGTLWGWGDGMAIGLPADQHAPAQIGTDTNWQIATGGARYSVALKTDGTLWSWGLNTHSQLGYFTANFYTDSPAQVGTDNDWQNVATGYWHSVALKTDGTLWTWGYSYAGQLGNGNNNHEETPVQIGTASNWQTIAAGHSTTLALKTDGSLWVCGALGGYSLSQVGTDTDWQKVYSGGGFAVALKNDGSMWTWGNNLYGMLGNGNNTNTTVPAMIACPQVLAVEHFDSDQGIVVHPNPAKNYFTIENAGPISSITIYDIRGAIVKTQTDETDQAIDVSDLQQGIYLLKTVDNKGHSYNKRLIKN